MGSRPPRPSPKLSIKALEASAQASVKASEAYVQASVEALRPGLQGLCPGLRQGLRRSFRQELNQSPRAVAMQCHVPGVARAAKREPGPISKFQIRIHLRR